MAGVTGDSTKIRLGPQILTFKGTQLGFTGNDTVAIYTPTYRDIMVNQLGSPVDKRIVKEKFIIRANMLEIDRDNILIAAPGASAASGAASGAGADFGRRPGFSVAQSASGILILHPLGRDVSDKSLDFTIPIAVPTAPLELTFKAEEETPMKIEFDAMADPTLEDGTHLFRFGY